MEKILVILTIILACISHTFCDAGNKQIEQGNEEGLPEHPIEVSKSSFSKTDNKNVIQQQIKQNVTGSELKPVTKPLNVSSVRRVNLLHMKRATLIKSKNPIAKNFNRNMTTAIKPVGLHRNKPNATRIRAKWGLTMAKVMASSNLTKPIKRIPIVVSNKTAILPVRINKTATSPGNERNKILPILVTFNKTLASQKNQQKIPPYDSKLTAFNKTTTLHPKLLIANKTSTNSSSGPSGIIQKKTLVLGEKRDLLANGKKLKQNNASCTARPKTAIGKLIQTRIVHGTDADQTTYPFIVSIADARTTEHRCGGSIIHDFHVLTAAHCCVIPGVGSKYTVLNHRTMRLQAGDVDLKSSKWSTTRIYRYPTKIIPHPEYNPKTVENDICIVRFPRKIMTSDYVNLIPLSDSTPIVGQDCEIAGWGRIREETKLKPLTLRKANIKIVSEEKCNGHEAYRGIVPHKTVCASMPLNRKESVDACQGDSGGPLVCNNELAGVVSWGRGCGRTKYPGIYTDVSQFSNWIQDIIEQEVESGGCAIVKLQLHVKLLMVMVITVKCCILVFAL